MKTVVKTSLLVSFLSIFFFLLLNFFDSINYKRFKNQTRDIYIGQKFQMSFNWGEKNPFVSIEIDTVQIIDMKEGYVKYLNISGGFSNSMREDSFKEYTLTIK
jgi:hypothetical protein